MLCAPYLVWDDQTGSGSLASMQRELFVLNIYTQAHIFILFQVDFFEFVVEEDKEFLTSLGLDYLLAV